MEKKRLNREAVTFDEVTLEDKPSDYHPMDVRLLSFVTRNIALKGCGIISAAMDTVTEKELALALAKCGGMGIIHRNLDPETQALMVNWVRRKIHYGGMIDKPICFKPTDRFSHVQKEIKSKAWTFTSFPVIDESNKLIGLLTRDEMDFVEGTNPTVSEIMKKRDMVITALEGTDNETAYKLMKQQKVKKLPVCTKDDVVVGMYVWNDMKQDYNKRDSFSLDNEGHFLVGAAIGLGGEDVTRAELLVKAGCKVLVMDSSHGACKPAKDQLHRLKEKFGDQVEIIVGNIASYDSATYLLDGKYKPDGLKVGIGPGSICTTRQVTGHGVPQLTAVYEVWRAIRDHGAKTGYYLPIIADGGIKCSGDIVKVFAFGASAVMLGSMLAGCLESPGKLVESNGKQFKTIRGMGSLSAMESRSGSRGRYNRQEDGHKSEQITSEQKMKLVPEGVEGLVQYRGPIEKTIFELCGGVQSGLAHSGAKSIDDLRLNASIWTQSHSGIAEGKPHSIVGIGETH